MKNLLYLSIVLALSLTACDQQIDYPYQGKDRIQFTHYTSDHNGVRTYYTEKTYSLGFLDDEIHQETIKIPVELLGRVADTERTYQVGIIAESTNAVEGVHYEPFSATQTFAAGAITDTLRIVVNRDALSTSFRNPEDIYLHLKIEPTDDFDIGLAGGAAMKIVLTNYLSEPVWWNAPGVWFGALDYYHPLKWKILISFNEKFADYDKSPYGYNDADGKVYVNGLSAYLNANVVVDEETNERLYMTSMVPYNP